MVLAAISVPCYSIESHQIMARIKPFQAVRPFRDKVALVTTRSYENYSNKERNSILELNPFSFLHILRPGFKFHKSVHGKKRFRMVRNRYTEFKENGIFQQDKQPAYYLHQKTYAGKTYWGIIGLASLEDYENKVIKKHERTLRQREELFGNYLEVTGFNAEPVLLTYPDNAFLESIYEKYRGRRAEYEFTTNKHRNHLLWLIEDQEDLQRISLEFEKMQGLYIADGHHRTASSHFLYKKWRDAAESAAGENSRYFMAYFIPESNLRITSFYRFVKSLNALSKEEFLIRLDEFFRIENLGSKFYKPSKKHHFSMYLDGEFYKLYLRRTSYPIVTVLDDLDSEVLYRCVLGPILGIEDLSNDKNIAYLPEIENEMLLKDLVDSREYAVGFGCFPVSVEQMKQVADQQLIMPPKSTYVEPKLRSGLTIYELK